MPGLFSNFPKIFIDLNGVKPYKPSVATYVLARFHLSEFIKKLGNVYYKYDIQEGDTPEIIASKYYEDPEKAWLVLLANDIVNPYYDWPLSYENLNAYIANKYGSIETAQATVKQYLKLIQTTDSATRTTAVRTYEISQDIYNSLPSTLTETFNLNDGTTVTKITTKSTVSCYDWEVSQNELKRSINIIDKRWVSLIENQLRELLDPNNPKT